MFRHFGLAAGAGGLLASGFLLFHQQLPEGFFVAFLALSIVALAESDLDFTERHDIRSFGRLLVGRASISTAGKLCDIASYFCLAAAVICWAVQR